MNRIGLTLISILVAGAACTGVDDGSTTTLPNTTPNTTGGSDSTTFDHDNTGISPWDLLARIEQQGPPSFTSHMHGCVKVRYRSLGNVLTDRGVNVANTTALSAGDLYATGQAALGFENYANRLREDIDITISGESREFDIFAAAAPEIEKNIQAGTVAACPGVTLFDASGNCQPSGITCLLGVPASSTHISLCNIAVTSASDQATGESIAVASLMAAAYTCE